MEDLIEHLVTGADNDSSGAFTLEPGVALEKLRDHLLQPENCLLYLLQSAVASGASQFQVRTGSAEVTVSHDGFFPSPEEVPRVLAWALEGSANRQQASRHRLALALASALAPPGRGLVFDYPDGTSLEWRSGKEPLLFHGRNQSASRRQIRVLTAQSWWRRILGRYQTPGVKVLRTRGRFAPLRLGIDTEIYLEPEFGVVACPGPVTTFRDQTTQLRRGEHAPTYFSDHHALEYRLYSSTRPRLALSHNSHASWSLGEPRKKGESCWAALGWRLDRSPGLLEVVQYGVSFGAETTGRLPDPMWMLLADDELATDVSCLKLIQDDQLWAKVEDLRNAFNLAFKPVLEEYESKRSQSGLEAWLVQNSREDR